MPLITFEGIDGSGKSSLMQLLAEHLRGLGESVETTREPGGTPLGQELREILLRTKGEAPCPEAELLIYEADRAHHVQTKIKPLLEKGTWVLSDRFFDSSTAFQGAGRKLKISDVDWLNKFAAQGIVPQLTVLVDCPVDVASDRSQKRGAKDRFEVEATHFHKSVRDEFLKLAQTHKSRFFTLSSLGKAPGELLPLLLDEIKRRGLL